MSLFTRRRLLALGLSLGCGNTSSPAPLADASAPPEPIDEQTLLACAEPEPCSRSLAQLIENSSHNINADAAACVLSALAARTPGRYRHDTDSTFSNGSVGAYHTLLVTESGSVLYTRTSYASVQASGSPVAAPPPDAGQRCTLQPASYFESCRAAVEASEPADADDTLAWQCMFGDGDVTTPSRLGWLSSCETESPLACE